MNTLDQCRAALLDPNVQAFLRVIRNGESSQEDSAYWWLYGSTAAKPVLATNLADHPRVKTYEKYDGQFIKNGKIDYTTAAGAYQIVASTWDSTIQTALRLPDFSPASQDLAAVYLLIYRKALDHVLAGRFEQACAACRSEWVSMPGASVGDQPTKSAASALAVFRKYGGKLNHELVAQTSDYQAKEDAMAGNPIEYPQPKEKSVTPFVAAALQAVLGAAPDLIDMFKGDSKSATRNSEAAKVVVGVAKTALGVANEQELIERLDNDPSAATTVREAVKQNWFEIHKAAEQSVADAREFAKGNGENKDVRTVIGRFTFIEFLTLVFLGACWGAIGLLAAFNKVSADTLDNIIMIAAVASIVGVREFWYGSSIGSRQKDERSN